MFHVKHIIKNVNHIKKKILRKVNSESEKAIIIYDLYKTISLSYYNKRSSVILEAYKTELLLKRHYFARYYSIKIIKFRDVQAKIPLPVAIWSKNWIAVVNAVSKIRS